MTSPIEPRTASLYHASRASAVGPRVAAAILASALATYLVAAALVPRPLALIAAQLSLAVVPIALVAIAHPARLLAALGLRGARPRFFAAAVAIGATTWYLNMRLVSALPVPEQEIRALEKLVDRPSLLYALAAFALLPAISEEILFRGVLARALGQRMPLVIAALISAAVFSLYHVSLAQALPTLTLGILLAIVAIRADSIAPTVVAHAINNALAIALSRGEWPGLAAWIEGHPTASLAGCAAATACGIAITVRGSPAT